MSLVMKRKSVRKYTNQEVSDEDIRKILTSAMQAPSAVNQQPWEFVVVRNRETLDKLSKVSHGAWMLAQAPLCIHVIMRDEDLKKPDMRTLDLGACIENILLEVTNLGLGACWIGVYPEEDRIPKIREILNIRKGTPFANIAIGHPVQKEEVEVRFDESRVHYEKVE